MSTIIRVRHRGDFTIISNKMLRNRRLSYRARGVLSYLLSRGNRWQVRRSDIENPGTREGKTAIRSVLRELQRCGYAKLEVTRHGKQWTVAEKSSPDPRAENPMMGRSAHIRRSENTVPPSKGELKFRKLTEGLGDFIAQTTRVKVDIKKWTRQLAWLVRQDLDGDIGRAERVIRLYMKTPHERYTPQARTPHQFRSKFLQIESWVNKHEPPPPKPKVTVVRSQKEWNRLMEQDRKNGKVWREG